jgi:hypothetical protein
MIWPPSLPKTQKLNPTTICPPQLTLKAKQAFHYDVAITTLAPEPAPGGKGGPGRGGGRPPPRREKDRERRRAPGGRGALEASIDAPPATRGLARRQSMPGPLSTRTLLPSPSPPFTPRPPQPPPRTAPCRARSCAAR